MSCKPKVIAIIVNWNNPQYSIDTVNSLRLNNYKNLDIVIVDNGSTDNSINIIKDTDPSINIISIDRNIGYGSAINYAFKTFDIETYDMMLALNNDVSFNTDYIDNVVDTALKYGRSHIFGSKIMYMDDKEKVWFLGGKIDFFGLIIKHNFIRRKNILLDSPFVTDYITGCSMLFYIDDFKKLLFDESFGMYCEDVDICLRARSKGFKCIVDPSSVLYHMVSASYGGNWSLRKNFLKLLSRTKIISRYILGRYSA